MEARRKRRPGPPYDDAPADFRLPDGRLLIDTPGMREIAFDEEGGAQTFADIEGWPPRAVSPTAATKATGLRGARPAINEGALTRDRAGAL